MKNKHEELLLRSLDECLSAEEDAELTKAKEESPELRDEEAFIVMLRKLNTKGKNVSFGPGFADKVLERIAEQEMRASREVYSFQLLFNAFRAFAVAAVLLVAILSPFAWYKTDKSPENDTTENVTSLMDEANIAFMEEQLCN